MNGMVVVEARICEARSHSFGGLCISDTNCANVCQAEGFNDGYCNGAAAFVRKFAAEKTQIDGSIDTLSTMQCKRLFQ
ncbi:hypothetical protein ACSBR2_039289 [Camellia fascicularis]